MNGDQADGLFARERAETFPNLAGGQSKTARAHQVDADEVAILGATGIGLRDIQFTAGLLLVDRDQPSAAGSWICLPRLAMVPSSASSRRIRFSSMRSAFLRPNSRAISRVPIFPGCARIKATIASRSGKTLSRCFATYPLALPALFLATGFVVLAGEVLAVAVTGARALLTASDLGFAAGFVAAFFAAAFLAGFGAFTSASALAGFAALAAGLPFLAPRFGLPPPFATRSSIRAMASSSVMVSCVLSLGMVALTPPAVT